MYHGTPLELATQFKYLGITLARDGSMHTAAEKIADNFRSAIAIARVYKVYKEKVFSQTQKTCHNSCFFRSSL